jgi:hypothetical protein
VRRLMVELRVEAAMGPVEFVDPADGRVRAGYERDRVYLGTPREPPSGGEPASDGKPPSGTGDGTGEAIGRGETVPPSTCSSGEPPSCDSGIWEGEGLEPPSCGEGCDGLRSMGS